MTLSEYENAVEEALANRPMELWEQLDLRTMLRFAKIRGYVLRLDIYILREAGREMTTKGRRVPSPSKPVKVFSKQGSLF